MSGCSTPPSSQGSGWSRRRLLRAGALLPAISLFGCARPLEPLLRIGTNVWPGYELLYLARDRGWLDSHAIKLVELLSATDVLQGLATDALEGGALTLDEVLTARASGIDLRIVAVLDISAGADALLVRPEIESLDQLRGKRIALEQSAVGAVLMAAALERAGLQPGDVELVYRSVYQHVEIFQRGEVDGVVTFDPARAQLLAAGADTLFDSRAIPGRIVDVLAVRPQALRNSPHAVRQLVASHFAALAYFRSTARETAVALAPRLGLTPYEVMAAFEQMELVDVAGNRELLSGRAPQLEQSAAELMRTMLEARLLPAAVAVAGLVDGGWLPAGKVG